MTRLAETREAAPQGETLRFMQQLWKLVHALDVRSKRMAKILGVTGPQRLVIRVVGQYGKEMPSARDIATTLGIHPSTLTGKRATTTVAPQALFMMNGKLMEAATRQLAQRLLARADLDDAGRLRLVYERSLSRLPDEKEVRRALDFHRRYQSAVEGMKKTPAEARTAAWQGLCRALLASNEFVYVE